MQAQDQHENPQPDKPLFWEVRQYEGPGGVRIIERLFNGAPPVGSLRFEGVRNFNLKDAQGRSIQINNVVFPIEADSLEGAFRAFDAAVHNAGVRRAVEIVRQQQQAKKIIAAPAGIIARGGLLGRHNVVGRHNVGG